MAPFTQKAAPPNSPFFCRLHNSKQQKAAFLSPKNMRLWSLHPSYLDAVGLVALWREGLLARKVLQGQTKGYIHHPQLFRFRETENPIHVLDFYLKTVHDESIRRGYNFDLSKISPCESRPPSLLLPDKQLEYEFLHLLDKLKERSPRQYSLLQQTASILPHPIFQVEPGDICCWEKRLFYN